MGRVSDLLRMLEPIVRPAGLGGAVAAQRPVESQSFEELLRQAQNPTCEGECSEPAPKPADPLASLGHVENAAVRRLIDPS